jgi:hypothetical protein
LKGFVRRCQKHLNPTAKISTVGAGIPTFFLLITQQKRHISDWHTLCKKLIDEDSSHLYRIILEDEMMVKIYALIWVFGLLTAAIFYLTGNLTPLVQVVFGFLTFGAVFMGMMSVLPIETTHHTLSKR